jgi:hypothetical protein
VSIDPRKKKILEIYGKEPSSLDELAECVIKVIENQKMLYTSGEYSDRNVRVLGFAWSINRDSVSNSFRAPLDGVTNLNQSKGKPLSYSGWKGRVWVRLKYDQINLKNIFDKTLTYVGSGGLGSYNGPWNDIYSFYWSVSRKTNKIKFLSEPQIYSWTYEFFSSDWPNIEKYCLFDIIKGDDANRIKNHVFEWTDPKVAKLDRRFLNSEKSVVV